MSLYVSTTRKLQNSPEENASEFQAKLPSSEVLLRSSAAFGDVAPLPAESRAWEVNARTSDFGEKPGFLKYA